MIRKQGPNAGKTILIVEDDPTNGEMLSLVIAQEAGHIPLLATNADDAIKLTQEAKPSLFILDYHLPGINGHQLYQHLHKMTGLERIPVIFLSASENIRETEPLNSIFMEKPFDLDELLRTIDMLLSPVFLQVNVPQAEDSDAP